MSYRRTSPNRVSCPRVWFSCRRASAAESGGLSRKAPALWARPAGALGGATSASGGRGMPGQRDTLLKNPRERHAASMQTSHPLCSRVTGQSDHGHIWPGVSLATRATSLQGATPALLLKGALSSLHTGAPAGSSPGGEGGKEIMNRVRNGAEHQTPRPPFKLGPGVGGVLTSPQAGEEAGPCCGEL